MLQYQPKSAYGVDATSIRIGWGITEKYPILLRTGLYDKLYHQDIIIKFDV